jgi:hypothetical protein
MDNWVLDGGRIPLDSSVHMFLETFLTSDMYIHGSFCTGVSNFFLLGLVFCALASFTVCSLFFLGGILFFLL